MMAGASNQYKLGDLLEIKHGFAFKGEFFSDKGALILLSPGNFKEDGGLKLKGEKEKYYSGAFPEDYLLQRGDMLIAMTDLIQNAPILGSPAWIPENNRFLHNQRLGKVTNLKTDKLLPEYLYYLFNTATVRSHIKGSATGSTVRHTAPSRIYEVVVDLPPLSVQRSVAGILSSYDELIENCQRRIRNLETMATSLYQEWFVRFRYPGHGKVRRVTSALGDVPEGWDIARIDDVCGRVTDGSHSSPKSVEKGMPMASSKDMHDWGLTLESCRFIDKKDFDELVRNGCKPEKGDVLITKDGANYLKHILVHRSEQDIVLLSSIAILRPNSRINSHLLAATLNSPETKSRLGNFVTGAAIPRIVLKDFKQFPFMLPPKQIQTHWAAIAEPLTELCWQLTDQIDNLRQTRDLLLPRLLSGQVELS
jgi:type I restriction enzyme S subunit